MKKTLFALIAVATGTFLFFGYSYASPITVETLQPANATTNFESIRVGVAGQGGVTFFNGSVLNESGPYVVADDLRVDGGVWAGPSPGTSDGFGIKIYDSFWTGLDNTNDIGTASMRFGNAYFGGNVLVGNLLGSNVVSADNISNNSIISAKIQNGTIQGEDLTEAYQTGSAYDSRFVSGVNAGTGLSGGGTSGDVILSLNTNYQSGSAYDGRFVNIGGDDMTGQLTVETSVDSDGTVYGVNSHSSGYGVYGYADATGASVENYGGYFQADGTDGRGVYGEATSAGSSSNYGGYFIASSYGGRGVYGHATSTSNSTKYGGYFEAEAGYGRGVYGEAKGASGIGVYGVASGTATTAGRFDGNVDLNGGLDISSTTEGFTVPRMTTTERDNLSAVNGMIVYNNTTNQFNFYENGSWVTK